MIKYRFWAIIVRLWCSYISIWSKFHPMPEANENSTWDDVAIGMRIMSKELDHTRTLKRLADIRDMAFLKKFD